MIELSELTPVGQTGKTHGLKGEINCEFTRDFDMDTCDYFVFDMDGIFVPFFIDSYRFKNDTNALITFDGIKDESAARELWGKTIYISKEIVEQSEGDNEELTADFLIGYRFVNEQGKTLGEITGLDESTDNVLFEMGDLLIPVAAVEVLGLDQVNHIAVVSLPEGLLDLNE